MLVGHKGSCHGAKPLSPACLDIQSKFLAIPALKDQWAAPVSSFAISSTFWPPTDSSVGISQDVSNSIDLRIYQPGTNGRDSSGRTCTRKGTSIPAAFAATNALCPSTLAEINSLPSTTTHWPAYLARFTLIQFISDCRSRDGTILFAGSIRRPSANRNTCCCCVGGRLRTRSRMASSRLILQSALIIPEPAGPLGWTASVQTHA